LIQRIKNNYKANLMFKKILFFLILSSLGYSQDSKLSTLLVSKELSENSNSIVRDQKIEIDITSLNLMQIRKKKIILFPHF